MSRNFADATFMSAMTMFRWARTRSTFIRASVRIATALLGACALSAVEDPVAIAHAHKAATHNAGVLSWRARQVDSPPVH